MQRYVQTARFLGSVFLPRLPSAHVRGVCRIVHFASQLKYTLGTKADMGIAREYFAQSLELKPDNNVRALYGLLATLQSKFLSTDSQANAETLKLVQKKLSTEYQKGGADPQCVALMEKSVK